MGKSLLSGVNFQEKKIVIGKIGAAHGIRGEVRIIPLTDFPDRFNGLKKIYLDEETQLSVESIKYNKQFIILKFEGYEDRDSVAPLNGRLLKVSRQDVPPLAAGEYYTFDLIGMDVFDETNTHLGQIQEILKTGSNDVYIVGQKGNAKQILVPALKKVVTEINVAENRMQVILPEMAE